MAPKNSAHTFARGIPSKCLFNPQRRQINNKNGLMLSTVTELLEMTQLPQLPDKSGDLFYLFFCLSAFLPENEDLFRGCCQLQMLVPP